MFNPHLLIKVGIFIIKKLEILEKCIIFAGMKNFIDNYIWGLFDSDFEWWADDVVQNKLSEDFYFNNEGWVNEVDGLFNKWLNMLYNKGKSSVEAAAIIERGYGIFLNGKNIFKL